MNGRGHNDGLFVKDVNCAIAREGSPLFEHIVTLDVSPKLTRRDFFALDDHLNAHGHKVIAGEIIGLLRKMRQE